MMVMLKKLKCIASVAETGKQRGLPGKSTTGSHDPEDAVTSNALSSVREGY